MADPERNLEVETRQTGVDLGGLLTVLGENLYSSPAVAVRELVQNAHDSIGRRRLEQPGAGGGAITIDADDRAGTLTIADDGAGLTRDEIHAFLATIGSGYTRVLRATAGDDELIGQFGLGFLTAYVVATEVTVVTTSFQTPHVTHEFRSRGGLDYEVREVATRAIGTTVRLALRREHAWMAGRERLGELLRRYCALLLHPITLAGDEHPVNDFVPTWRRSDRGTPADRLACAQRFAFDFAPLSVIDVAATDDRDVNGLLWIHDAGTYATSDNRKLTVYVRAMMLDDDARDLLPRWAGFVSGVIESHALTPTASREDLKRDDAYDAVKHHLSSTLVDGLARLARSGSADWRRVLRRHNEALLGAAIVEPQLFDAIADQLTLPTSHGDLTLAALAQRSGGRVHVALGEPGGFEAMLFQALGVPVARGDRYGVHALLAKAARSGRFELVELGTERGNIDLFAPAELEIDDEMWLLSELARDDETVVAARFEPAALPLVVVVDRDVELKRRIEADDADERIGLAALSLARMFTASIDEAASVRVYVNRNCPIVERLLRARVENPVGAGALVTLLRTIKTMMASASGDGRPDDLAAALRDLNEVARQLTPLPTDGTEDP